MTSPRVPLPLVAFPSPLSIPPPKPGRPSWEEAARRQLRLRRMVELLTKGMSYRSIAKDLGVSHTTVLRMKAEAAAMTGFADVFMPMDPAASTATTATNVPGRSTPETDYRFYGVIFKGGAA